MRARESEATLLSFVSSKRTAPATFPYRTKRRDQLDVPTHRARQCSSSQHRVPIQDSGDTTTTSNRGIESLTQDPAIQPTRSQRAMLQGTKTSAKYARNPLKVDAFQQGAASRLRAIVSVGDGPVLRPHSHFSFENTCHILNH
jgi:hypothetical protein